MCRSPGTVGRVQPASASSGWLLEPSPVRRGVAWTARPQNVGRAVGALPVPCRLAERILDEADVQRLFLPFLYSAGGHVTKATGPCWRDRAGLEAKDAPPTSLRACRAGSPIAVYPIIILMGYSVLKGPLGPFTARGLYARKDDVLHGKSKSPLPFF